MQGVVEDFISNNDVEFKMVATVNGEDVIVYTSAISFDDVSGFADQADRAFDSYVFTDLEDSADLEIDVQTTNFIATKRGF